MTTQWKGRALDGGMQLYVEAARYQGRRHLIATHEGLTIKLPIPSEIEDERLLPLMTQRLEAKIFELLSQLTAPKQ